MKPISRAELIKKLKKLGYQGPFQGGNHAYMLSPNGKKIIIPNIHSGKEIGEPLLSIIVRELDIDKNSFEKV